MLPGLGRDHRILDVLEVVGLDRPVRPRTGGDALSDDLGNATSHRDYIQERYELVERAKKPRKNEKC